MKFSTQDCYIPTFSIMWPHLPSLFTCCGHFVYHWCFWVVYISCSKNLYFLGLIQTNQISPNLLLIQFLGYWEITLPNSILPGRKRNVLYSLHDFNLKVTSSSTTGRSVKSHTYNTLYDLAFQRDVAVPTLIVRLHWCHCKVQIINTSVVFRIAKLDMPATEIKFWLFVSLIMYSIAQAFVFPSSSLIRCIYSKVHFCVQRM